MKQIAHASWVASIAQAIQYTTSLADGNALSSSLSMEIEGALFHLSEIPDMEPLPRQATDFWKRFTSFPAGPGLQRVLSQTIYEETRNALRTEVKDNVFETARLIAVSAEIAGTWLTSSYAPPSQDEGRPLQYRDKTQVGAETLRRCSQLQLRRIAEY